MSGHTSESGDTPDQDAACSHDYLTEAPDGTRRCCDCWLNVSGAEVAQADERGPVVRDQSPVHLADEDGLNDAVELERGDERGRLGAVGVGGSADPRDGTAEVELDSEVGNGIHHRIVPPSDGTRRTGPTWCVQLLGSGGVFAQPDRATAVREANAVNNWLARRSDDELNDPTNPAIWAVVTTTLEATP